MILIADSGSTKTDWCGLYKGRTNRLKTQGINPFHQTTDMIQSLLYKELLPQLPVEPVEAIYFYGAGCTAERGGLVRDCLLKVFGEQTHIEVHSDLLGAARAMCGHNPGIVCILGTGSNSCYYDGRKIDSQVPSLGYILGDEGSGAYFGKRLVSDCLKHLLPQDLEKLLMEGYGLSMEKAILQVYRMPLPNRYLAGFAPFLSQHRERLEIQALIHEGFTAFVQRNLKHYPQGMPVYVIGTVAYTFKEELKEVLAGNGYMQVEVAQSPMKGLVKFHKEEDTNQIKKENKTNGFPQDNRRKFGI